MHLNHPLNAKCFTDEYLFSDDNIVADNLIIAGDSCSYNDKQRTTISQLAKKYKTLIEVPGNHDNYDLAYDWPFANFSDKQFPGTSQYYLNNSFIDIDNIRIICSTLWSNIQFELQYITKGLNDYHYIKGYNILRNNQRFIASVNFIETTLANTPDNMKCIVVTHHLPLLELISHKYHGDRMNEAYASNLYHIVDKYTDKIKYWIYGHSHEYKEVTILNTTFIRNPYGYLMHNEGSDFNSRLVIEI